MANESAETIKEINDVLQDMGISSTPETPPAEPPAGDTPPETPPVETPPVETPPVEVPKDQTPVEQVADAMGVPPVTPPVTPPVETPPAETAEQRLARENEELRAQLLTMATTAVPKPAEAPSPTPEQIAAAEAERKARGPVIFPFFKKDEEIDAAFKDAGSANRFMTGVVAVAVEMIAQNMPQTIQRISNRQVTTQLAIKEFYEKNQDLSPYKQFCGFVTNQVASEKPEITLGELFKEVASRTRTALKLAASAGGTGVPVEASSGNTASPAGAAPTGTNPGPALPPAGGGGGRKTGPAPLSGLEKEIAEVLDIK